MAEDVRTLQEVVWMQERFSVLAQAFTGGFWTRNEMVEAKALWYDANQFIARCGAAVPGRSAIVLLRNNTKEFITKAETFLTEHPEGKIATNGEIHLNRYG